MSLVVPAPPRTDEKMGAYCTRLDHEGVDEMGIRMGLREHFGVELDLLGELLESYPRARLRHIQLVHETAPGRSRYSLAKKIAKDLGISDESAEVWVGRWLNSASNREQKKNKKA